MSTRSVVAVPTDNGFKGRYVHSDGYPSHMVPTHLGIVARLGLDAARTVLTEEHYSWSGLHVPAEDEQVPGRPHSDGPADAAQTWWWTLDDFPDSSIEWVYVYNDKVLTVLQAVEPDTSPTASRWRAKGLAHVGDFAWGSTPTDEQVRVVECGERYERCKHLAWAHMPQDEREQVGDMSMRQWLGHEPLTFRTITHYLRIGGERVKLSRSGGTGTAQSNDYVAVMRAGKRTPRYWWGYIEGSHEPIRLARITKAGYKLDMDMVLPATAVSGERVITAGSIIKGY